MGASAFLPLVASTAPPMVTVRVAIASYNYQLAHVHTNHVLPQGFRRQSWVELLELRSMRAKNGFGALLCENFSNDAKKTYNVRSNLTAGDSVHGNHLDGIGGN